MPATSQSSDLVILICANPPLCSQKLVCEVGEIWVNPLGTLEGVCRGWGSGGVIANARAHTYPLSRPPPTPLTPNRFDGRWHGRRVRAAGASWANTYYQRFNWRLVGEDLAAGSTGWGGGGQTATVGAGGGTAGGAAESLTHKQDESVTRTSFRGGSSERSHKSSSDSTAPLEEQDSRATCRASDRRRQEEPS